MDTYSESTFNDISLHAEQNPLKHLFEEKDLKQGFWFNTISKTIIIISLILVIFLSYFYSQQLFELKDILQQNKYSIYYLYSIRIFFLINVLVLLWRIILMFKYRPAPDCDNDSLPSCTVIVPAFNEGKQVFATLKSIASSDYPRDKLRIIAVDDGSIDDTFFWINKAAKKLSHNITTIKLQYNQGKRRALYHGINKSNSEVIVTVDSDSVLEPITIRSLVSPFVHNKRLGAVAGNVRVLNLHEGMIPRMLDVVFLYSFDFIRAGQSVVNTVICTPGALSAYRSDILLKVLPEWLDQKFFGQEAKIGEDRAMTNLILREGFLVHFQRNAYVYTNVPTQYRNLCKMLLRWARSNIRETYVMSKFAFRKFRKEPALGARINLILQLMTLSKGQLLLLTSVIFLLICPSQFSLNILFGVMVTSSIPAILYVWHQKTTDCLWAYAYGLFWLISLSWITPYALITPYKSDWLTR